MPRVGPGDDNITGDRYTLDLGVEPDLGNLLQNLQVANDLLDAAEQKFRDISDIVQSGTQRMAQFTRQTSLAAAEAQRLQNSYSQIASSSFTLANIGGMAMGGNMGGGMPGYFPGQMAFGGMPPTRQNMIQTMPSSVQGSNEDIAEFASPPPARAAGFPISVRAAALEELAGRYTGGRGGLGRAVNKFRYGWQLARHGKVDESIIERAGMATTDAAQIGPLMENGAFLTEAAAASRLGPVAGGLSRLPLVGGMFGEAGTAGALGTLGGAVGAAAPWAAGGVAAYKLWAGQMAEARRLSGMTGNTGIFGGVGGGAAPMKARSLFMGMVHPGVDYGRVQEEALGTGAIGENYGQTRDFLFEAAKRGMSDSIDMVDLYQEAVSKAGGTTEQLTNSLDRMRTVASVTNANLTAMTKNYKANMEQYIALGMSGGAANFASLTQATAYPTQSALARVSPVLRNSGGIDVSNPYLQAQVTANLGIGYTQLGIEAYRNPSMAAKIPVYAEQAAKVGLQNYGFKGGMDGRQISAQFANLGGWPYAGQILAQQGLIPPDVDPNDQQSVITAIQVVMSGAVRKQYKETQNVGAEVLAPTTYDSSKMTGEEYVNTKIEGLGGLGLDLTEGGFLGIGQHDNEFASLAHKYESYINQTGSTSPIMDAVLQSDTHGADTYVRGPDGQYLKFEDFVNQHSDWQQLLDDEKSGWQMGTADATRAAELNSGKLSASDTNAMLSDIVRQTGDQFAQGGGAASTDPNDVGRSVGSQGEFDLGEKTLARLDQIYNPDK